MKGEIFLVNNNHTVNLLALLRGCLAQSGQECIREIRNCQAWGNGSRCVVMHDANSIWDFYLNSGIRFFFVLGSVQMMQ
jgi:hypothetical protein